MESPRAGMDCRSPQIAGGARMQRAGDRALLEHPRGGSEIVPPLLPRESRSLTVLDSSESIKVDHRPLRRNPNPHIMKTTWNERHVGKSRGAVTAPAPQRPDFDCSLTSLRIALPSPPSHQYHGTGELPVEFDFRCGRDAVRRIRIQLRKTSVTSKKSVGNVPLGTRVPAGDGSNGHIIVVPAS